MRMNVLEGSNIDAGPQKSEAVIKQAFRKLQYFFV
jgi:hypothetical protein